VGDVLDLSKLEAGKLELRESGIDLDMLIDEVMAMLRNQAEEARVAMTVASKISGIMLRGDKRSVKQVLLNLLSNAVKFTPEGGTVTLTADCDGEGRIGLSVADTGIGMSDADIAVALSPFGQIESHLARKYKGTGLGLPICKSLVQLHGGTLTVSSRRNCGTTITARFPAERTIAPALKSVAG
jgi:signal transduction histidine kinase